MMLAPVGLLAALALLVLFLLLVRSFLCPPPAPSGSQVTTKSIGISGQPGFWTAYNYNGDATAGPPTTHQIQIGSDDGDLDVGGATASSGEDYMLVVTGLTSGSASAVLKQNESSQQTVTVTDVETSSGSTDTFTVYLRRTSASSSTLQLYMLLSGKGVQVEIS